MLGLGTNKKIVNTSPSSIKLTGKRTFFKCESLWVLEPKKQLTHYLQPHKNKPTSFYSRGLKWSGFKTLVNLLVSNCASRSGRGFLKRFMECWHKIHPPPSDPYYIVQIVLGVFEKLNWYYSQFGSLKIPFYQQLMEHKDRHRNMKWCESPNQKFKADFEASSFSLHAELFSQEIIGAV